MGNIAITGATSMIGIGLIKAAIDDPHIDHIYACVRPASNRMRRIPLHPKITVIECEVNHYGFLKKHISEPVEVFYHLAWPRTPTYEESFEDTYEKTKNILYVLDALKTAYDMGCKTFVGAGSQSEYGIVPEGKISENTVCRPVRSDGVIHLAAGSLVEKMALKMGMNSAWLRVFSVYGTNDRENSLIKGTIRKLLLGEKCAFTESKQMWDFLYEDDAGTAFLLAGKKVDGNKTYNVGYGEVRPLKEFISVIKDIVSPNTPLRFGELPYPSNPIMNLQCDNSALIRDTGWHPVVPFRVGIQKVIQHELGLMG